MNDIQALAVEKAGKEFVEQALLGPTLTVRDLLIALYQDHMMLFGESGKPLGLVRSVADDDEWSHDLTNGIPDRFHVAPS